MDRESIFEDIFAENILAELYFKTNKIMIRDYTVRRTGLNNSSLRIAYTDIEGKWGVVILSEGARRSLLTEIETEPAPAKS